MNGKFPENLALREGGQSSFEFKVGEVAKIAYNGELFTGLVEKFDDEGLVKLTLLLDKPEEYKNRTAAFKYNKNTSRWEELS